MGMHILLLTPAVLLRSRGEPFFPLSLRGERTCTLAYIHVHAPVQKNNKDTRHNEDLKAPHRDDNYREPTLQPSKGLNVKRYTSQHHYSSFYGNVHSTFSRCSFYSLHFPPESSLSLLASHPVLKMISTVSIRTNNSR